MSARYYAVIVTTIDKSGMIVVERVGYSTSEGLRHMFAKTCSLTMDKNNGHIYSVDFVSLHEMYSYMLEHYNWVIAGDDNIVTLPVNGTLSPYHGHHIVTTVNDAFNSDSVGFMRDAETLFIRDELKQLSKAHMLITEAYFLDNFKSYSEVIELAITQIIDILTSTVDSGGNIVIDTEQWDIPQYGIMKGRYVL